jgi:putative transposase
MHRPPITEIKYTAERTRHLLREICKTKDVEIIKGCIVKNHIHLFVSVPPCLSISKLMQSLKGKTSCKPLSEYKEISKQFWGRRIWGRGCFAASSGHATDEVIMAYIETQDFQEKDGDFRIAPQVRRL